MTSLAIDARSLARRYGRRWALADVTFQLERGRVLMIAGRNGAGKSTLLRTLATAIRPHQGSASVQGFDLERDRYDVRRVTALLGHQSFLYESLTAFENLAVAADVLGSSRSVVPSLLARVGLDSRANDPIATFSAGMRKRLSFARVLLQEADVVLLDEPYGQLDPQGFSLVDEVIGQLRTRGATVLMATHQLERASALADEAIILDAGRVAWRGTAAGALDRATGDDEVTR
ncbi:MAG: heme ABC exporter ATP-binding protein CcmA [Thermoanaerobaculia bacterium]